ncbi:MAG: haloacid dehalogenase [Herpetosiphonaceae bacterium]|nr:MAG: haloacid dehalogenase [Herpetosiphonaceae bacterium]
MIISAVILDFDGLILDTETSIFEAWRAVFREYQQELSVEVWGNALGTHGGYDPCAHLCELTGLTLDSEVLRRRVHEAHIEQCLREPLLPGVLDVLHEARAQGLRTAVASSSSRGWVERWLAAHRIHHLFDTVCARDDVKRVKPAPDLFLLAAERLDVPPERCLVFEDSPNGIRAARSAGMRCVAVPNAISRMLPLPDPDLVVRSLAEIPLTSLIARLGCDIGGRPPERDGDENVSFEA